MATTSTNDALEATEKALAHLCLHVDESDLPETFDPKSGANLDVVVSRKVASFSVEGDFATRWTTCARLAKPDASFQDGDSGETDEIEALEATLDVTAVKEDQGSVMTIGDVCLLVPSTYPSIPAMVLKKGASQKAHAAWATLAFSSVGEPMLFDLVEAAKNPTGGRAAAAAARRSTEGGARRRAATAAAHASTGPRLVVAAFEWPAAAITA